MSAAVLASIVAATEASGTASNTWPYVIAAWVIVFGALAAYAAVTLVRGRRLSRRVPPERRRWS